MVRQDVMSGLDGTVERVSLSEVFGVLWRWRARIVACAAGVLAVAVLATLWSPLRFRVRSSLYLGELQSSGAMAPLASGDLDVTGQRAGDVGTEIEILRSRSLIERAVLSSGLNVGLAPEGTAALRYWRWRLKHRAPRLLDPGPRLLQASDAALAERGDGRAEFTVRFGDGGRYQIASSAGPVGGGVLGTPFSGGGLSIILRAGPEGSPAPGSVFVMNVFPAAQVADDVARELTVATPKGTTIGEPIKVVTLELQHASPHLAIGFLAAIMRGYLDSRLGWKTEEATAAETFVTEQSKTVKRQLDDAERQLADYKAHSDVVALGDESRGLIDQLGKFEEQRIAARLHVASFDQVRDALRKPGGGIERYLVGEGDDPVLASMSSGLAQARQELRRVQERFTAEAPATIEQRSQVQTQLKMIKEYLLGRSARAEKQLASLNEMIEQLEGKLKSVPTAELELARLTRNAEVLAKMYSFLLERQQQAAVSKAATMSRNRILDSPEMPLREDSPALMLRLVLATLVGLFIGIVVVLVRWTSSPAIESDKQLARVTGDLPTLAAIPRDGARWQSARAIAGPSALVAAPEFAEAFRHLRASLYGKGPAASEVVLMTSSCPGDGKTLCTISLAAALAADGKRVLVIEADMRKPSMASLLGLEPSGGFSALLARRQTWAGAIVPVQLGAGRFDVLPSLGFCPNATELLSGGYAEVVRRARAEYQFVLVDSPPFPLVSDGLVLARQADRVVSVLRIGHTVRRAAQQHLNAFASGNVAQAILVNDVDPDRGRSSAAYYYETQRTRRRPLGRLRAAVRRSTRNALSPTPHAPP